MKCQVCLVIKITVYCSNKYTQFVLNLHLALLKNQTASLPPKEFSDYLYVWVNVHIQVHKDWKSAKTVQISLTWKSLRFPNKDHSTKTLTPSPMVHISTFLSVYLGCFVFILLPTHSLVHPVWNVYMPSKLISISSSGSQLAQCFPLLAHLDTAFMFSSF